MILSSVTRTDIRVLDSDGPDYSVHAVLDEGSSATYTFRNFILAQVVKR